MMSIAAIHWVNEEIAAEAASESRIPYVPWTAIEVDGWDSFPFPNLGYYVPPDWEKTDQHWFVDKSGVGLDWEPALTIEQFRQQLRLYAEENPDHGYAISEEGEFQLYVSAYQRTDP